MICRSRVPHDPSGGYPYSFPKACTRAANSSISVIVIVFYSRYRRFDVAPGGLKSGVEHRHLVLLYARVAGDKRQALHLRLSDEHAVKWIAMVRW